MSRTYFHVTSSVNRASIEEHGLDWRRMGATHGVAGVEGIPPRPEVPGIFLVDDEFEVRWFAQMALEQGHKSVDVWAVTLPEESKFVGSQEGYQYFPEPIRPESLRLHHKDWTARDPSNVAGDLFEWIQFSRGPGPEVLHDNAVLIDVDGNRHVGREALGEWLRAFSVRKGHRDQGFHMQGIGDETTLVSPIGDSDIWTLVSVDDNRVTEIREFSSEDEALRAVGQSED